MAEPPRLAPCVAGGGCVESFGSGGWRLSLPAGDARSYRLAQLDDYGGLARSRFPWEPPLRLGLRARVSTSAATGTWGFGLWNDPFGMGLALGGGGVRLPALPNTAWFFHASSPNHLAFRDGHPVQGFLAATFSARRSLPSLLGAGAGAVALPALASAACARVLRRLLARAVDEDAATVGVDPEGWHSYEVAWRADGAGFSVDGAAVFEARASPRGPLGLVLWIDNQFAALPAAGRLRFGTLTTPEPLSLEIADIRVWPA